MESEDGRENGTVTKAAPGFEPGNGGFADLCLTTWLCRLTEGTMADRTVFKSG